MAHLLGHRGPDDRGFWRAEDRSVGLAHTRLSILDLSPMGHQPMWDASGRYCIVFNGEIYNYRDLRRHLDEAGIPLRGNSDTEVLVNLYALQGMPALARLNGIFAFAIWDSKEQSMLLARDGLGVKPLYFAKASGCIAFASELKALMRLPGLDTSIDPAAIAAYLGLAYAPGPLTPIAGVRKWDPGTAAIFDRKGNLLGRTKFYSRPVGPVDHALTVSSCQEPLLAALDLAVERQLVSDAPVGAFLSGGLDSTAIVASAVRRCGARNLPCYTIRNISPAGSKDGFVTDLPYARRAAAHLGVELREVEVHSGQLLDLDAMVWALDEPQPDPAALNTFLITRQARADGIKVMLSGAGGDDLFSGYRRHLAVRSERYWAWLPHFARAGLRRISQSLPQDRPTSRRLSKMFRHAEMDDAQRLAGYFLWLGDSEVRSMLTPEFAAGLGLDSNLGLLAAEAANAGDATPLQRMLYLDQAFFLTDHNLNYTDKMSMLAGVETRVPFLDPDLMRFAATIPDQLKIRGSEAKWIFKEAMCARIPRDIAFRPKSGFGAPLRDWLHRELRPAFEEYLGSDRIRHQGVFDPVGVRTLMEKDRAGSVDAAYPLFAVLTVDSWLRQFRG